jgi:hypothetical protein
MRTVQAVFINDAVRTTGGLISVSIRDVAVYVSQKYAEAYSRFLSKGGIGKLPPLAPIIKKTATGFKDKFDEDALTRAYIALQTRHGSDVKGRESIAITFGLGTLKAPYSGIIDRWVKTGSLPSDLEPKEASKPTATKDTPFRNTTPESFIELVFDLCPNTCPTTCRARCQVKRSPSSHAASRYAWMCVPTR